MNDVSDECYHSKEHQIFYESCRSKEHSSQVLVLKYVIKGNFILLNTNTCNTSNTDNTKYYYRNHLITFNQLINSNIIDNKDVTVRPASLDINQYYAEIELHYFSYSSNPSDLMTSPRIIHPKLAKHVEFSIPITETIDKIKYYITGICNGQYQTCFGIYHMKDGKLHRTDGPAIIHSSHLNHSDGCEWYFNGQLHRDNGPAVISEEKGLSWYKHGKLHRLNGPAYIWYKSIKKWYVDGKLHRINGPAIIDHGRQEWFYRGLRHRVKGPAYDDYDKGHREWFYYGKRHNTNGPAYIDLKNGIKEWFHHGKYHRIDGAAVIRRNEKIKQYWVNGKLHRPGKPALIQDDCVAYYFLDKLHRIDGPAQIMNGSFERYFLNGLELTLEEMQKVYKNFALYRCIIQSIKY